MPYIELQKNVFLPAKGLIIFMEIIFFLILFIVHSLDIKFLEMYLKMPNIQVLLFKIYISVVDLFFFFFFLFFFSCTSLDLYPHSCYFSLSLHDIV